MKRDGHEWGSTSEGENGNGSLRCIQPLSLFVFRSDTKETIARSFEVSTLTHARFRLKGAIAIPDGFDQDTPILSLTWRQQPMRSNRFLAILHSVVSAFAIACAFVVSPVLGAEWEVQSPNGRVRLVIQLATPQGADYPQDKPRLYYRVEHGAAGSRTAVIGDSPLGLVLGGQDFVDGLAFQAADEPRHIDEHYTMPRGKRHECRNEGTARTLRFANAAGAALELELRAYNDGAGFRYVLPGTGAGKLTLQSEATGFALSKDLKLWMEPHEKGGMYTPAYETFYENGIAPGTPSPTGAGWSFPVLFCTADEQHWGLIADAAVGPDDYGAHLTDDAPGGVYRVGLPDSDEGRGYGAALPWFKLPWKSAWRAIILGDSPGAIVESTLVDDLNPPCTMKDTDWIRPGRVAWSWWSDPPSPTDGVKMKQWVDWAVEMGWEYVCVDANWPMMDNGNVHDVIRYAQSKGVGVLLWYNGGGPINIVTEKPRDALFFPEVRRFELNMLKDWGVKGLKVDFFQSDKPEIMALYHDILKDAADARIMISYHGCTMARGWSRTYPHLVTMEAVRGEETYMFDERFPDVAPVQNTIHPFARNAIGPMDYTPMGLTNQKMAHKTTYAHELALTVLFETGWLHFADDPDVYRALPAPVRQFMRDVPVDWDETRYVAGYPGREAVLARRHGDAWYVAGVNGRNEARDLSVELAKFLAPRGFAMTLITDGPDATHFASQARTVNGGDALKVHLLPYGGFIAQLKPAP